MLQRLLIVLTLSLLPISAALAVTAPPPITAPVTLEGALLDKVSTTTLTPAVVKTQGILGYTIGFHTDQYQYVSPLCGDASLLEVNGRQLDPSGLIPGDTLAVSLRPNANTDSKSCINRLVREKISRGPSQGQCLQSYQVLEEVDGQPDKLVTKQEYTYVLSIYNRPTLDCDAKAYGASPITTTVAASKPFIVYLDRQNNEGTKELMRWSLTTGPDGKARISYTFAAPSNSYKFHIMPGGTATAGDIIDWSADVLDSNPSPSPTPVVTSSQPPELTAAPVITVLVIVLLGAGAAEYWHWVKKKRVNETPEQEYQRTPKF